MATAILAAGGILVRHDAGVDKIALVKRARYPGEIGLPKGKAEQEETFVKAAIREVREETGCVGREPTFAGTICYFVGDTPKIVFFYRMELESEHSPGPEDRREIANVEWVRPLEAVQKLTHAETRRLITEFFGLLPTEAQATDNVRSKVIRAWWDFFSSAERDRLADRIVETRIDLDRQAESSPVAVTSSALTRAAYRYLIQAEQCLRCCNLQRGWVNVQSARRMALANTKEFVEANHVAITLRHELEKVTGWRSKAIAELIFDKDGNLPSITSEDGKLKLVTAVSLMDEYSNTSYFKILLRRRSLFALFLLLCLAVFCSLFFWSLPHCLHGVGGRILIILSGILGAGVSVAQNLLSTDISAKIPAQQIGAFLVWMRPAIGAAGALFAVALIKAGSSLKFFDDKIEHNIGAILVIAFAAGFSERFITQAIGKISDQSDKR